MYRPADQDRMLMATDVEQLDPNSEKGRAVVARLSITLAHIRVAIARRKAEVARQATVVGTATVEGDA